MAGRLGQRLLLAALTSLVGVATFSGNVAAQEGNPEGQAQEAPTRDDAARVLALVKNANDEFDRGEFGDALRLYEKAYQLYPESVLLYRIGLSAEKVGDIPRAIEAYQLYVDAAPAEDPTAQSLRTRVTELKGTLPAKVTLTSNPAGASVHLGSVDAPVIGKTPVTLEIPPGDQTFLVRLEGYRVSRESVTLAGGEERTLGLILEPLKRLGSSDPGRDPTAQADGSSVDLGLWGFIAGATGVALIGTGIVFEMLSQSRESDVNEYDKRAPGASRDELQTLKDQSQSHFETAVATFIAGGVLTAAGVVLIILDQTTGDSDSDEAGAASLRLDFMPTRGGGWVGLSGRF